MDSRYSEKETECEVTDMVTRTIEIRRMEQRDAEEVLEMMKVFYASSAVLHKASEEVLRRDIADCISEMPFVDGYVFDIMGRIAGYAMVANSYSTEFGGRCVWIEDLYMKPEFRGMGLGTAFFQFVEDEYAGTAVRFRLEAEAENESAIALYRKCGYEILPYVQMTRETEA